MWPLVLHCGVFLWWHYFFYVISQCKLSVSLGAVLVKCVSSWNCSFHLNFQINWHRVLQNIPSGSIKLSFAISHQSFLIVCVSFLIFTQLDQPVFCLWVCVLSFLLSLVINFANLNFPRNCLVGFTLKKFLARKLVKNIFLIYIVIIACFHIISTLWNLLNL